MLTQQSAERGTIFFYILLAVALFAGLTYAVSGSNRQNTSGVTDQRARLAAQEIIDYTNDVAAAVQKLKLRGCSDTEFDFANDVWINSDNSVIHAVGHNASALVSRCSAFDIDGGAVEPTIFDDSSFIAGAPTTLQGMSRIMVKGIPAVGNNANIELIYVLPSLQDNVCLQINEFLGVENPANQIPQYVSGTMNDYSGAFPGALGNITDTDGVLAGQTAFCSNSGSSNDFIRVLIAR